MGSDHHYITLHCITWHQTPEYSTRFKWSCENLWYRLLACLYKRVSLSFVVMLLYVSWILLGHVSKGAFLLCCDSTLGLVSSEGSQTVTVAILFCSWRFPSMNFGFGGVQVFGMWFQRVCCNQTFTQGPQSGGPRCNVMRCLHECLGSSLLEV